MRLIHCDGPDCKNTITDGFEITLTQGEYTLTIGTYPERQFCSHGCVAKYSAEVARMEVK